MERPAWFKILDDLPGAEILFVGVGADEVEVELIGASFGEEIATPVEGLQIEELVFHQAMNGFDVALKGVERRAGCGHADCRLRRRESRYGGRGGRSCR